MSSKSGTKADVVEEVKLTLDSPKPYVAVMHNDNTTTFDFVYAVLTQYFDKTAEEAEALTMHIHLKGRAVVMRSSLEYLETVVSASLQLAQHYGFTDFNITIEKESE